jgi:uncharacterized membrane protein
MTPSRSKAFIGLHIMFLSTSLYPVFRTLLPYDMDPDCRTAVTLIAAVLLLVPWCIGLAKWKGYLSDISEKACTKSLIGGLIIANLGLLYICATWSEKGMFLEDIVAYVAWPSYLGMLLGYSWVI